MHRRLTILRHRLSKTPMVVGGRDVLIYTTLGGSVGALIPFTSKSDVDFMTDLEMVRDGAVAVAQSLLMLNA